MYPVDPAVPVDLVPTGSKAVVIAKDQPQYTPLPTIRTPNHRVITRWRFTQDERDRIAAGEDLFLVVLTAGALQPVRLTVGLEDWSR